jgi:CheY-like chemotaxis protein
MDHNPPTVVVLVVDDEPLIRMNTADFLEDSGFKAIEAENAEDAMAQLDAHPEINVLFTDINMPGAFDGLDLARKVYASRPDIQLLITSGKMRPSEEEIPDHGKFFSKPYSGRAVAQLIAATQHANPSRPSAH